MTRTCPAWSSRERAEKVGRRPRPFPRRCYPPRRMPAPPAVDVRSLSKTYKVHERAPGLRAALKSVDDLLSGIVREAVKK